MGPDDDEDVLELTLDVGDERQGAGLLEDDGDDVVADVPLPRQLLLVVGSERQKGGHVKHHFIVVVGCVDRIETRRIV